VGIGQLQILHILLGEIQHSGHLCCLIFWSHFTFLCGSFWQVLGIGQSGGGGRIQVKGLVASQYVVEKLGDGRWKEECGGGEGGTGVEVGAPAPEIT